MPLTLDEIVQYQERLQGEIVERECLLASLNILHKYAASGDSPKSFDLSCLSSALPSSTFSNLLMGSRTEPAPASAPAPAAPKPYVKPYVHPELDGVDNNVQIVRWAIRRMTDDYSVKDIRALLAREGFQHVQGAEISVVLTRLKRRGEIEEIEPSRGPVGTVFRKPSSVPGGVAATNDPVVDAGMPTAPAAA